MAKISNMSESQLKKLIEKAETILEDRRDDLEYREIRKTKGRGKNKVETDEIDYLIVELKGKESAEFTRLAKRYFEVNEALKELQAQRDAMNQELKEMSAPLWDAKDQLHQRFVATVSYGFTLTAEKESEKVNWKNVAEDLANVLNVEAELLKEMIAKNTKITKAAQKLQEPSQKHQVAMSKMGLAKKQDKVDEAVDFEKAKKSLSGWFKKFTGVVEKYLGLIDRKLDAVKKELSNA